MLASNYARTYKSNSVLTAGPGQLVLMLFDGALRAMANAREALARPEEDIQRLQVANAQLLKAQAIIGELQSTLNMEQGGEISSNLDELYRWSSVRLLDATVHNDPAPIEDVLTVFRTLRDGWNGIASGSGSGGQ